VPVDSEDPATYPDTGEAAEPESWRRPDSDRNSVSHERATHYRTNDIVKEAVGQGTCLTDSLTHSVTVWNPGSAGCARFATSHWVSIGRACWAAGLKVAAQCRPGRVN